MPSFRGFPACSCLAEWLPAYEHELLRRGLIKYNLDVFQLIGNASASAGTHSKGGCADLGQRQREQLRVARNMGAAAWERDADPNDGQPDFRPSHAHLSLKGCPHAVSIARAQIGSCENRHNGLAGNGPDDGPRTDVKFPLRTYKEGIAWAKAQTPPVADPIQWHLWKVTLPIGQAGHPTETASPIPHRPWYGRDPSREWMVFRAYCGGVTTSGSKYPRSELRELRGGLASWSTSVGTHQLSGTFKITHTPVRKPHVVCAQIHDANDDVVMVRLEGKRLFVESRGHDMGTLIADYPLGDVFNLKIVASNSAIDVTVNATKVRVRVSASGCYFKAGCYTQSNLSKGDKPEAYGEVWVKNLRVEHT